MSEPDLSSTPLDMRVLVLLDQPLIAEVVRLTLKHGFFVTCDAQNSTDAVRVLADQQPRLAVLDIELVGPSLFEQVAGNREVGSRIPVVGLTRRGDLKSKLDAFEQGVDDIMTMPFSPEELLARALAATRRAYGAEVRLQPVLKLGEIELDILKRRARVDSLELHLSSLEQSLLYLLAANAGRVVTRDQILDALWGVDFVSESSAVDRHVRSLRAKLQGQWRKPRFITTIPGRGYRFVPTSAEDTSAP